MQHIHNCLHIKGGMLMIKRPLVWMALAQITGIAGAVFDMMWLPSAFAIMVIISAVMRPCHDLYLSGRRSRAEKSDIAGHSGNSNCGNIITTVLILIFIFAGAHTAQRRMNTTYPEDISQISGKVTKIRNKSSGKQIQISCSYADRRKTICRAGTHYNLIVYVPYGTEECGEGDTIIVSGRLSDFDSAMNPGEFDAKKYYASLNVNGKVNADSISVIRHNENRLLGLIFAVKAVMQQSITKCSEAEDAGIVMSMILGDKSELDSAINVLYQRSGIAHILAISGVKTLKLDIPLVPETRINWAFVPLHIAIIYILKLCLDEEIIPRCRFPCSRGYFTKCIN